jgi:hypothetical protein
MFTKQVKKWTDKVKRQADHVMQQTANSVSDIAVDETGVSTGRLMGSWTPGKNAPNAQTYQGGPSAWDEGFQFKDEQVAAANAEKAKSYIKPQIEAVTKTLDIEDTYYLTNPVPYARQAEYQGWENTGPYMMMHKAVSSFHTMVALAVQSAKKVK